MTVEQVCAEVRRLAAESPDCKYPYGKGCFYTRGECTNGSTGCIVGQAFRRMGLDCASLDSSDRHTPSAGMACLNLGLEDTAIKGANAVWLSTVQAFQDSGHTWGQAVADADDS